MVIYVSAVAEELEAFRSYLADRLGELGHEAIWVDSTDGDPSRILSQVHQQLQRAGCLIQIVGMQYGPAAPFVSGTNDVILAKFEASFAENLGVTVWRLVLDESAYGGM